VFKIIGLKFESTQKFKDIDFGNKTHIWKWTC